MITVSCGYMEQPDVRNDLKELQRRGMLPVSADRWIIEVGEEDIIASADLPLLTRLRVIAFSWILRLSTPAHKYLELVYDAAVSKEFIPVMFSRHDIRVPLPELVLAPPQMMAAASDETVFSDYFPWLQTCEPLKIESRHFGLLLPQ
ncbi:MAG: KUP/HAK/KT family potassium transporter [Planctomycetota bacterium]